MTAKLPQLLAVLLGLVASSDTSAQTYTISTFAGGGLPAVNVPGTSASLYFSTSVATDKAGNIFFADQYVVLRLDATTDFLTVAAGNGTTGSAGDNGPATSAQLNRPAGVAVDSSGNLYIADYGNQRIRKVSNGVITTVPGTTGFAPGGVAVDSAGSLYIADAGDERIRKVTNGVITIVAGNGTAGFSGDNGPAISAQLNGVNAVVSWGTAVDTTGNLYIADPGNQRIRKVSNGVITTVAGNGVAGFSGDNGLATSAQLNNPFGIAVDTAGNLYLADTDNRRIRMVSDGVISTVAGGGSGGLGDKGPATSAQLDGPYGVAVDTAGNLYVADHDSYRIRKISNGFITTVAGNGTAYFSGDNSPATSAQLCNPHGTAVDTTGNLYIADPTNSRIRKVSNGVITTVAGTGTGGYSGDNGPATSAQLGNPYGVALDALGNLYIADTYNGRIRKVSNGVISTLAGGGASGLGDNGPATSAQLSSPYGIAVDTSGNLYIADTGNNRIRKVSNGVITTVAGSGTAGFSGDGGPATSAQLNLNCCGILAVDSGGNLYIADAHNYRIRKVSNGVITTVVGSGMAGFSGDGGPATSARLSNVYGVALDASGNLYIADTGSSRIRKVTNGLITTIAGGGMVWGDGGPATSAQFNSATHATVDTAGNVYISDTFNNRIRLLTPSTTLASQIITFVAPDDVSIGASPFTANATASSGLTVSFVSNTSGVCTVSGSTVMIVGAGTCSITASQPGNATYSPATAVTQTFLVSAIIPAINPGGVVPLFSSVNTIEPGSWISIFGTNLVPSSAVWNGSFENSTSLGGVSVTIHGRPAYISSVTKGTAPNPDQINMEAPDDTVAGSVPVVVTSSLGSATSTVTLAQFAPSFSLLDNKHVAGIILTPNGTGAYGDGAYDIVGPVGGFPYPTRPVKTGETLILYGVGFGPTTSPVPAGVLFSGAANAVNNVTMTIGGVNVPISFAGISYTGQYQFNLVMPSAPGGDQAIVATVGGVQSPANFVVTVR